MKLLFPLLLSISGCAAALTPWSATDLRAPDEAPPSFVTEDGRLPAQGCRNPLFDPRDRARLLLVRSGSGGSGERGDYEVPPGRYGVGAGELLRIECTTGQPLGIVRR